MELINLTVQSKLQRSILVLKWFCHELNYPATHHPTSYIYFFISVNPVAAIYLLILYLKNISTSCKYFTALFSFSGVQLPPSLTLAFPFIPSAPLLSPSPLPCSLLFLITSSLPLPLPFSILLLPSSFLFFSLLVFYPIFLELPVISEWISTYIQRKSLLYLTEVLK